MYQARSISEQSASILDQDTARDILKRTLAIGAVVASTTPAVAELVAGALLRDIGRGSCGSVFEIPGTALAIKKGLPELTRPLRVPFPRTPNTPWPRVHHFNGPQANEFWTANITRFPEGDRTRAAAFDIDHILPVPEITRKALVRNFFKQDSRTQQDVLRDPDNTDCLIRVYFGQNRPNSQPYDSTDTLRNFPLYLDEAKAIGLDIDIYAEEMAIGLAILHWKAGIDAQDTEFVIGSSTTRTFTTVYSSHEAAQPPTSTIGGFTQEVQLWMLDYDKCTRVDLESMDSPSDVVEKYLVAVTGNDPYFPHPRLDPSLWRRFRNTYLKASEIILMSKGLKLKAGKLPAILIEQWEQWGDRDMEAQEFDPFERDEEDHKDTDSGEEEAEPGSEDYSSEEEDAELEYEESQTQEGNVPGMGLPSSQLSTAKH